MTVIFERSYFAYMELNKKRAVSTIVNSMEKNEIVIQCLGKYL